MRLFCLSETKVVNRCEIKYNQHIKINNHKVMQKNSFLRRIGWQFLAVAGFSTFAFANLAMAAPVFSFTSTPAAEFKLYESPTYTANYTLAGYEEDVNTTISVKGPLGGPGETEVTIASPSHVANGNFSVNWDGKFSGNYVAAGNYELKIVGTDLYANVSNTLTHTFAVTDLAKLSAATAASSYVLGSGNYAINFHLDTAVPACVHLYVNDVDTGTRVGPHTTGDHSLSWNAMISGSTVAVGSHTWKLKVQNTVCGSASSSLTASGSVAVSSTPTPTPDPDPTPETNCAGFSDVLTTDPRCPAIKFVKDQGIFSGYPDGSFRQYDVINRAETTKVILLGFGKTILAADGSNLGFSDVEVGAWYMTYLRTAKLLNIIKGYPDGTVKPAQQVNRVELLKIFFETAGTDLSAITGFLTPYVDVSGNVSDVWYLKYVQYAKVNALVDADGSGKFNPSAGMKRGDVAELFYRYDVAIGL
jgi:hypothetical protein